MQLTNVKKQNKTKKTSIETNFNTTWARDVEGTMNEAIVDVLPTSQRWPRHSEVVTGVSCLREGQTMAVPCR